MIARELTDAVRAYSGYTTSDANCIVTYSFYTWTEHDALGPVEVRLVFGARDELALVLALDGRRHIVARDEVHEVTKAHRPSWAKAVA